MEEQFNLEEQTAKIEAALQAGEFDKAVELVGEVPEDAISQEVREKSLALIEEKRAAADQPAETAEPVQEEPKEAPALSKDLNSKNAIKGLQDLKTADQVAAYVAGEERKTVLSAAKVRAAKLEAEANPLSKRLDIVPAIAAIKALGSKAAITAFIVEETRPDVIEAAMAAMNALAGSTADVPKEIVAAVDHARAKGFHDKMVNLVAKLPAGHPYKTQVLQESENMRLSLVKGGGRIHHLDRGEGAVKKVKEVTAQEIMDDWQALNEKTIRYEAQRKLAGRPFRHIQIARRQLEVRLAQFKRNAR